MGRNQRGWFVPLEASQYAAATNPHFYLYVVDNVRQGDPLQFRLKVFSGERLARLLQQAKLREYWELPIPVREFDEAPGPEGVAGD